MGNINGFWCVPFHGTTFPYQLKGLIYYSIGKDINVLLETKWHLPWKGRFEVGTLILRKKM